MADERFVSGLRVASMVFMMDATETFLRAAIWCSASINSCSSEILV